MGEDAGAGVGAGRRGSSRSNEKRESRLRARVSFARSFEQEADDGRFARARKTLAGR